MTTSDEPTYLLTSDQDWAPHWAMQILLKTVGDRPLHLFRTNPCPVADEAFKSNVITQGWHPNFLPGSSHGDSPEEVVAYMQKHFPGHNTARNHTYFTGTHIDRLLFSAGIRTDSQTATRYQANLVPLLDISGTTRLPVFFEDDIFFDEFGPELDLGPVMKTLFTPGLKIFNVHATFIACNTPTSEHYAENRELVFGSEEAPEGVIFPSMGSRSVLIEIMNMVEEKGGQFQSFQDYCDKLPTGLGAI